jgi:hypothetical protein
MASKGPETGTPTVVFGVSFFYLPQIEVSHVHGLSAEEI